MKKLPVISLAPDLSWGARIGLGLLIGVVVVGLIFRTEATILILFVLMLGYWLYHSGYEAGFNAGRRHD